ncbi:MAG: GAF domain-containing protein [Anaerolineales bacterium]
MILTRRLIVPAAIMFTAFLAALFAYFFTSLHNAYHEAEERSLTAITNSFSIELEHREQIASTLAATTAGNPAIQEALANQDREALSALVQSSNPMLSNPDANVTQNRFFLPDGTLLFSASASSTGEESPASASLPANIQEGPVSGLGVEGGTLVIRGLSPVFRNSQYVGVVEYQIGLNAAVFESLREKYGADWRVLLPKDLVPNGSLAEPGPNDDLLVVTRTGGSSIFNTPASYTAALNGTQTITHPSKDGRDYALLSSPIFDSSGQIIGVLDILYDHTHISAAQNTRLVFAIMASLIVLTLGLIGLYLLMRRTLQPIQVLTRAASEISEGKPVSFINAKPSSDEIGVLIEVFNRMTSQLRSSITDLEQRVQERTRDLEDQSERLRAAAEISKNTASLKRLDEALERSAKLILDRFKYYHVGIYIIDSDKKSASLVASPTDAGEQMLYDKYEVRIGDTTVVGRAAATGEPRAISGKTADSRLTANTYLPDTRSELALPLKVEDRVIGILDIHSEKEQAFTAEDISVMLVLADQLASALERTRLLEESTNALNELERAYGRFTSSGWQKFTSSGRLRNLGYRFDNIRIEPVTRLTETSKEALLSGNSVVTNGSDTHHEVAIPIKFRGQIIGVVHAKIQSGYGGETAVSTLELAVDRLASSLESARLYEEAKVRADREQTISQITSAISSSSDYETILRTTIREIGHALKDTEVGIQIVDDAAQDSINEGRN